MEACVSRSAYESRRGSLEKGSSWLSSFVKHMMESLPSEAVTDIKPEMDDGLVADEPLEISTNHSPTHGAASRHSAEIYRLGQGQFTSQEEFSRKRKVPVASSVVRVNQEADEDISDVNEVDTRCGTKGLSSRVSLPSKVKESGDSASLQGEFTSEDDMVNTVAGENPVPFKKQRVMERCKFWPVCKNGDKCLYRHPTTQCKTFPNCKFGNKCLFVHPTCKIDASCTKPDCPFTHVIRRSVAPPPPPRPAVQPVQPTSVYISTKHKKADCLFHHPKPCRFGALCRRRRCNFYHPTKSVPPRHALKWRRAQSSK